MAVPSYTTDLADITDAETTTGWSAYGGGASGLDNNADIAMQGGFCVGKQISGADKGQYFDNGAGITLGAGEHIFTWHFCGTPGLTDTIQNKGASILIGSGSNAYCQYHIEGNDTYGAAGRIAKCHAVDYTNRNTNASAPYRTATGSPAANPQVFGGGLVTTASVKGFNCGIDAIRRGTGAYLTAGELISAGDGSDNPCTFGGFNAKNDQNVTGNFNRWGLLTALGAGYEMQGIFAIGQNTSQVATLCRFEDSDVNISVVDAIHAASTFNKLIIDHASTVCNFTNISITALGTANPLILDITANNPTVTINGGTWTGLGTLTFRSNSTVTGLTMRTCNTITGNGASFTDCLVDKSIASSAMVVTTLNDLDNVSFISDGTGHAVNLGTISSNTSMNWNCNDSGYAASDGSTGNETILVNVASGITLTINVGAGYSTPTIYNTGPGTVNVVSGQVTLTLTGLKLNTEVRVYSAGTTTELDGVENSGTSFGYTYTYAPSTFVDIVIHHVDYEYIRLDDVELGSSNASLPIQQVSDRWYNNP